MMKSVRSLLLLLASCASIISCASSRPALAVTDQMLSEAVELRRSCKVKSIDYPEVRKADSLLAASDTLRAKGKTSEAYYPLDLAAVFYRLAFVKFQLIESQRRAKELEISLSVARAKLATYEKLLKDLEQSKK